MATDFEQLPAEVDLNFVKGDEIGFMVTFENTNLTGYTYDSRVYSMATIATGSGGIGAGTSVASGATVAELVVTPVSVTAGSINLSMQENVTNTLAAGGKYRWWLKLISPGLVTRAVISGDVNVRTP